jgi:hypothetical protein
MSAFETTLGFIAMAVVGIVFVAVVVWFIVTQAHFEHTEDAERRIAHGRHF